MWAAQTTLLAPTVTLSPMVIGKKAMFPWQATNLDYTGFWTTILLQQMDFYHRHVALLIELEHPINACCQHVSTMSMMLDYFTTSVQRITERGHVHWLFHCFLTYLFINTAPWRFTFPAASFCTFLSFKMSHVTLVLASHVPTLYFLYEGLKTQFSPMITCLPQPPTDQGLQRQPLTSKKEP